MTFGILFDRDQRLVVEFDSVHGGTIYRHLSPDEGAECLHRQKGQEDRRRCLGFRRLLFVTVARIDRDRTDSLSRISDGRTLRYETLTTRISGWYSRNKSNAFDFLFENVIIMIHF